jgi:hypothetical protein
MDHESDEPKAWWEGRRGLIAFAVAPLAAPLIVSMKVGFAGAPDRVVLIFAWISLVLAYLGTVLLGRPVYLLLRSVKLTAFWPAPLLGFAVGVGMACLFLIWLPMSLGQNLSAVLAKFDYGLFKEAVEFGGVPGAAVGALLWLIARPDRVAT